MHSHTPTTAGGFREMTWISTTFGFANKTQPKRSCKARPKSMASPLPLVLLLSVFQTVKVQEKQGGVPCNETMYHRAAPEYGIPISRDGYSSKQTRWNLSLTTILVLILIVYWKQHDRCKTKGEWRKRNIGFVHGLSSLWTTHKINSSHCMLKKRLNC